MCYSPDHVTPEVEKQTLLQMLLSTSGGREGAIQYLEYVKKTLHPNAVQIGVRCLSAASHLILITLGCCSFNAPRETFNARVLNSITSKSFTILRGPTIFHQWVTPGTFISLAQVL